MKSLVLLAAFAGALSGCAYLGTLASQMDYSLKQLVTPEQRVYKHMLDRDTYFVFGRLDFPGGDAREPMAVLAVSDRFSETEVVDVSHRARLGSYYRHNLPAGEYRLLVVSDLDGNGVYDASEVVAARALTLGPENVPGKVLGGYDIQSATRPSSKAGFRVDVLKVDTAARAESLFFPKGALRQLDDPVFSPEMAALGLYEPAAFLEAVPMMFYALEEDAGHKIPVVFVHGIGGSARDFEALVARLDRRRFKPWFFYYPSGSDLNQLGELFYQIFVSGRVIPLGEMPMVIVAYSMGGLVAREALNFRTGGAGENRVHRLITLASPLGGHPAAAKGLQAPVVIPSWRDLSPDSDFIAGLHRTPLPSELDYHLLFAYADDRLFKLGENSDGVVPLPSQLDAAAQAEAKRTYGVDATHRGLLRDEVALAEVLRIVDEVRAPYPDAMMRALMQGGYAVELGPLYTAMEAYCIHHLAFFMEALVSGELAPFDSQQRHFLQAVRGEIAAENPAETAWIKFAREYPDRRAIRTRSAGEVAAQH